MPVITRGSSYWDCCVQAARSQVYEAVGLSVGSQGHEQSISRVPFEPVGIKAVERDAAHFVASLQVVKPDRAVRMNGCELPAIRRERSLRRPIRLDLQAGRAVSALEKAGFKASTTLIWMEITHNRSNQG